MTQNPLKVVMTAMNHPHGLEILQAICRLTQNESYTNPTPSPSIPTLESIDVSAKPIENTSPISKSQLSCHIELQQKGVDIHSSNLLKIADLYPERLTTAINAWLKWESNTVVKYPTLSLMKAIEEDWRL